MRALVPSLVLSCCVVAASVAAAQERIDLVVASAEVVDEGEAGKSLRVTGRAPGAPDGLKVLVHVGFPGVTGVQDYATVYGEAFKASFGPTTQRILAGTYEGSARVDPRVQRSSVGRKIKALTFVDGRSEFQVGDAQAAARDREELGAKYAALLERLGRLRSGTEERGTEAVRVSGEARIRGRGVVDPELATELLQGWSQHTEQVFAPELLACRGDLRALNDYALMTPFPDLDAILAEIITTLDRWHAAYEVATHRNLGRRPSADVSSRGGFSLRDLNRKLSDLSRRGYRILGREEEWERDSDDGRERLADAEGDTFRSSTSGFEVKKPGPEWAFDVSSPKPSMRLRIRPLDASIAREIVVGVTLREHEGLDSVEALVGREEELARARYERFSLVESKRLSVPDAGLPDGAREGLELRFEVDSGPNTWFVVQYTLFAQDLSRTWNVVSFVREDLLEKWLPTVEGICQTFKVTEPAAGDGGG